MSIISDFKKMSCETRDNKRRSFINNFYDAYSKFFANHKEKLMGKKEFRFRFNNKKFTQYKFPNIYDDSVLMKGGDIFFDGKEFKVIQDEVSNFFDKKLLTFNACQSSSGKSESLNAIMRRKKRNIIFKCFIVFNNIQKQNKEKELIKVEFNEMIITNKLRISDCCSENFDSSIHDVFYCADKKMFGIKLISNPGDAIDPMTCNEENIPEDPVDQMRSTEENIPEDPLVPLEENISETTLPSTSSSITISTVRNDDPSLLFETINGTKVFAEDVSFEVTKIVEHFYGQDEKLYFKLQWKDYNGQNFEDSCESASLVHSDNLIQQYIREKKIKKLEIPQKRKCKLTNNPVLFDKIKEKEKLLNIFKKQKK